MFNLFKSSISKALLPTPNFIYFSKGRSFNKADQINPNEPINIHNNHYNGSKPHYATLIAFPKNVKNII